MGWNQVSEWNVAVDSEYRREELIRAAENERMVREAMRGRQPNWFGRLFAKLRGPDNQKRSDEISRPIPLTNITD